MRVVDSRIRKEKVADSKLSEYVWTGLSYQPRILVVQLVFILSVSFVIKLFIADHDWNGIKNKSLLEKDSATSYGSTWYHGGRGIY